MDFFCGRSLGAHLRFVQPKERGHHARSFCSRANARQFFFCTKWRCAPIDSERRWTEAFAASQNSLATLADEGLREFESGGTHLMNLRRSFPNPRRFLKLKRKFSEEAELARQADGRVNRRPRHGFLIAASLREGRGKLFLSGIKFCDPLRAIVFTLDAVVQVLSVALHPASRRRGDFKFSPDQRCPGGRGLSPRRIALLRRARGTCSVWSVDGWRGWRGPRRTTRRSSLQKRRPALEGPAPSGPRAGGADEHRPRRTTRRSSLQKWSVGWGNFAYAQTRRNRLGCRDVLW